MIEHAEEPSERSVVETAPPARRWAGRVAFAALCALSILLLLVGRGGGGFAEALRNRMADLGTPLLELANAPVALSRGAASSVGELLALREENARLRRQNERLLDWQTVAHRLALENAALRDVLNIRSERADVTASVTTRVVADSHGPYVNAVLVDAGTAHGVSEGMAAVNEFGLVGRVLNAGRRSARILLLTDLNSRVPVMVERTREPAVLAGDNADALRLVFLPLNPKLKVGDRIVTSGLGGLLPQGLPVGVIETVASDEVLVRGLVEWQRLEYVRLLEYPRIEAPDANTPRLAAGGER